MSPRFTPTSRSSSRVARVTARRGAMCRAVVGAEARDEVGDAHGAAVRAHVGDVEALAAQHLARASGARSRRGASACTTASACPASRGKSASTSMVEIATTPPGPQRVPDRAQVGGRVGQVLDDVPDRDRVEVSAGIGASSTAPQWTEPCRRAFACSAAQRDGSTPRPRSPSCSASSRNVPMWQPTSSSRPVGRVALHVAQALGERRDATLLLLDVADVLDGAVQRPAPSDGAGAGSCTRASSCGTRRSTREPAELLGGRRVVALRVDLAARGSTRSGRGSRRRRTAGSAPRCRRARRVVPGARRHRCEWHALLGHWRTLDCFAAFKSWCPARQR